MGVRLCERAQEKASNGQRWTTRHQQRVAHNIGGARFLDACVVRRADYIALRHDRGKRGTHVMVTRINARGDAGIDRRRRCRSSGAGPSRASGARISAAAKKKKRRVVAGGTPCPRIQHGAARVRLSESRTLHAGPPVAVGIFWSAEIT
jgi:hypothetical protein